jgi:hypothetical protein
MEWYTRRIVDFLLPLSGSDLLPTISKSRQRNENGVTMTLSDYGDAQVNREQTMGAGHKGVANGTQYHNGRQDGSNRYTKTRYNNHSRRLWI